MGNVPTRWWHRQAAPAPWRLTLAVLAIALLPALAGAVFNWSVWLTVVLLVPSTVLMVGLGQVGGRERGWPSPAPTPPGYIAGVAVCAVLFVVALPSVPERYLALVIVGLGVMAEVGERAQWRKIDRRAANAKQSVSE